jgi:hypothetical protein
MRIENLILERKVGIYAYQLMCGHLATTDNKAKQTLGYYMGALKHLYSDQKGIPKHLLKQSMI